MTAPSGSPTASPTVAVSRSSILDGDGGDDRWSSGTDTRIRGNEFGASQAYRNVGGTFEPWDLGISADADTRDRMHLFLGPTPSQDVTSVRPPPVGMRQVTVRWPGDATTTHGVERDANGRMDFDGPDA